MTQLILTDLSSFIGIHHLFGDELFLRLGLHLLPLVLGEFLLLYLQTRVLIHSSIVDNELEDLEEEEKWTKIKNNLVTLMAAYQLGLSLDFFYMLKSLILL